MIEKVIDGDTVILTDQRHIRLIGINTPELDHNDYAHSQTGALIARDRLIQLLGTKQVYLHYDEERLDRHGRTLAHLYLSDGSNVQATLLEEGLAIPLIIPPNLKYQQCYAEASQLARLDKKGLWRLKAYTPYNVASLTGKERGFHIIYGTVKNVSESRSSIWINLENNVALRINKLDLKYFSVDKLKSLINKKIEVNGWLYRKNNQQRMQIRHPFNINIDTLRN